MKVLLLCLATLPALAQQPRSVVKTAVVREAFTADTPPEKHADEQTKALTAQLDLRPAQVGQVRVIALTSARAYQAMLREYDAGTLSGTLPEGSRRINQEFETSLTTICTPAQRRKRQQMLGFIRRIQAQHLEPAQPQGARK